MVKKLIIGLIIILFAVPLYAADISSTTCPGAGCTNINTEGSDFLSIQISGTFTGTITFSSSVDGTNFITTQVIPVGSATPVSTTTAVGIWGLELKGLKTVRVAFTAYTDGTAVVISRQLR